MLIDLKKHNIILKDLPHAILLCGEFSDLDVKIAKYFICQSDDKPCDICKACSNVLSNADVTIIDINPITVDVIRNLVKQSHIRPLEFENKVYIIRNAENMNVNASNALLKTLEEPPSFSKFILTTKNPLKLLDTIISRCSVYNFNETVEEHENEKAIEIAKAICDKKPLNILSTKISDKSEFSEIIVSLKIIIRDALLDKPDGICSDLKRKLGDRKILQVYNVLCELEEKFDFNITINNLLYYFVTNIF